MENRKTSSVMDALIKKIEKYELFFLGLISGVVLLMLVLLISAHLFLDKLL